MLVAALIGRESSFQKRAVSKTGAKGLGQIKDFNFKSLEISDPFDIKQNIRGTVRYLKNLKGMWEDSNDETRMVLASYYQGPNKTKKTHDDLPNHVTNYVDDILKNTKLCAKDSEIGVSFNGLFFAFLIISDLTIFIILTVNIEYFLGGIG